MVDFDGKVGEKRKKTIIIEIHLCKDELDKENTKRNEQGNTEGTDGLSIDLINQGCRSFSTRQTPSTFFSFYK